MVLSRRQMKRSGIAEPRSPCSFDIVSSAGDLLFAAQVELLTEAMGYGADTVLALYQGLDEQWRAETLTRVSEEVRSVIQYNLEQAHPSLFTVTEIAG